MERRAGLVLQLDDQRAADATVAGAKAANLARCAAAGMPILPGFVMSTAAVTATGLTEQAIAAVQDAWSACGGVEGAAFVVRSSSTVEDAIHSSMAGQFTSVLDVVGWPAFVDAVSQVARSAAGRGAEAGVADRPMAVLVQRQLDATLGGVLFTTDPVSGNHRHVAVDVVSSRPDELVGGTVTATHFVLSRRGRVLELTGTSGIGIPRPIRRALVALGRRAERTFGVPQDIEWATDVDGKLWLLQSRPVTAIDAQIGTGHVMGPGPVAETFPAPLRPLEVDLLLEPLRAGISRALEVTGAASHRRIAASPVVRSIGGWAAVDLELLGVQRGSGGLWQRLSPIGGVRRLVGARRVGRLRVALPELAGAVVRAVDDDLSQVGALSSKSTPELVDLIERARREKATVHTYEVLAGMLLDAPRDTAPTGAVALAALAEGRARDASDAEIIATSPVVLALSAPSIAVPPRLPAVAPPHVSDDHGGLDALGVRDALRLRARWIDELLARCARVLGARLAAGAALPSAPLVAELTWAELQAVARGGRAPTELAARAAMVAGPPLPAAFRLSSDGQVVDALSENRHRASRVGIAAGGGRGAGIATHDPESLTANTGSVVADTVLVTRHLEPALAVALPHLRGLVSETGSPLSHVAILAREMHVPTVVGVPDALVRYPPGVQLLVDGSTGVVEVLDEAVTPRSEGAIT